MSISPWASRVLVTAIVFLYLHGFASRMAGAQEPIPIPRLTGAVIFDGRSDEPAWEAAMPLPTTAYEPVFGMSSTERTAVRIAHDGVYLYVAGRFYDAEPSQIRAQSLTRDRTSGDDHFGLVIDSFGDRENALYFLVTPAGTRQDAAISGDAEGRDWFNLDWNAFWDARTIRTEEGWFVEMRVPFSSLRFQNRTGTVVMGISVARFISRKSERHVFPAIAPTRESAYLKPSLLQQVQIEGVQRQTPLYIASYVLAGLRQDYTFSSGVESPRRRSDHTIDSGLDLKYSLTSSLTLDLTVNTDFAQVEADDQQINLTRFSLFHPEKRPFFQERAGIFYFSLGGPSRLFHSRRIGLSESGEAIRILGGSRLVGRLGSWDLGALNVQTGDHGTEPGENFGVLRLRRQILNDNSTAGLLLTTRLGREGAYNIATGMDASVRLRGDDYLTVNLANTIEGESPFAADGSFASATLRRRRVEGMNYFLGFTYSGPEFDPTAGFELVNDYTFVGAGLNYGWIPGRTSLLRRHGVRNYVERFRDNSTGRIAMQSANMHWWFEGKSGSGGGVLLTTRQEDLAQGFVLPGATQVPAGTYSYTSASLDYRSPAGRTVGTALRLDAGSFYDGWRLAPGISPTWHISPHLELEGGYEVNVVRFPSRGQDFETHIARLRARGALNTRWSASSLLQYTSTDRRLIANARVRFEPRDGNVLWIVYNEGVDAHHRKPDPLLPRSSGRTLLLKYAHTFQ